jgi:hypothetical protein
VAALKAASGLRSKRLLRRLPVAAREWILRGAPAGALDRDFLLDLLPAGSVGAEIGVHEGDFSRRILRLARPRRLHLIDPWRYESAETHAQSLYGGRLGGDQARMDARYAAVLRRFRREVASGQVDVRRQRSDEACAAFEDDSLDWVYIDGDHRYEQVLRDLELYSRTVKPGGLLTGDDYGDGGWWGDGVRRAVDGFLARGAHDVVQIRDRQFVLRKRTGPPIRPA